MKLLNKAFGSIEEVVGFVKNNKEIREKWYKGDIIATADHKFQVEVESISDSNEDYLNVDYDTETGETFCTLCVDYVKYIIGNFNSERNLQSVSFFSKYSISHAIVGMFDAVFCPGDMFVYDKPCDGMGSYDIYAIANVSGIIMAEFISNSAKSRGSDEHEIGTKGLESFAMMEAWQKYQRGEGKMKHVEEYANANISCGI